MGRQNIALCEIGTLMAKYRISELTATWANLQNIMAKQWNHKIYHSILIHLILLPQRNVYVKTYVYFCE